jgi:lysophospholipase L1-like esterase
MGEAARGRAERRWRLPPARPQPVSRVVSLRLGLYLVLVALLVLLHPLDPVPMLLVSVTLAVIVVVAQQRWRLPPGDEWDTRHLHLAVLLTLALTAAGVAIVVVGLDDAVPRNVESLHSLALFLAIAMVFIGAGMFESVARREGGAWYPASAAVLLVLAATYFAGIDRLGTGWWTWVPLVAVLSAPVFLGIVSEWVVGMRRVHWAQPALRQRRSLVFIAAGCGLIVAARWLALVDWWVSWWTLTWIPPLALLAMRHPRHGGRAILVALAGIVLLPLVLVHRYHLPEAQVWLLAVLMAVVVLIAVDNNTDVLFIVVLAAVTWSGLPRSVPLDDVVVIDPARPAMAALGDSFISGEGAQRFYTGTNRRARNECRRAPTAYPVLLATLHRSGTTPGAVLFLACSGARAEDLWRRAQFEDDPAGGPPRSQLDRLVGLVDSQGLDLDLVLVSIGGNDAAFGLIARTCFAPGPCEELQGWWHAEMEANVAPALDDAFDALAAALPDTRIVVVPYPVPIAPVSCAASTLTSAEHRFLHDHTVRLNAEVGEAARRAGVEFAHPVEWALLDAGQVLCGDSPEPGVNWLDLNPVGGSLAQTANPRNWLHNSLHPNEIGHATIAVALARWLEGVEPPRPSPPTGPVPYVTADLPSECREPARGVDVDACERAWMFRYASAALVGPSLVLLALVGCYWLVAVEVIGWWRARGSGTSHR